MYRRFEKEPLASPDGKTVSASAFPLRDDSYNRGLFCRHHEDVLYDETKENNTHYFAKWGVAEFAHADFTAIYELDEPKDLRQFHVTIAHVPNECMYPHSQMVVTLEGVEAAVPKSIRTKIRERLLRICRIVKHVDP
ncbi:hypothetical protein [Hymenobacter ruricola]|uniref:Uncharacterized protein n=1 Tax=Hymenobacter ruricola TaxID=2791023 RepID=A0ABS0I4B7_9BACT|nr:hypothetical protein [Hymenobacter ruricola]MBF9221768.1 hypothetical protein [Hymenobacter ruricola]